VPPAARRIVATDAADHAPLIGRRLGADHILVPRGPDRVIAHNRDWLGTFRTAGPLTLDSIYYRWVHNYRHGRNW
jgi:hypothetical protein